MPDNPVKGTHVFQMGDEDYTLRFSWDALAQVHEAFPDGHNLMNPAHLSKVLEIGLAEYHPDTKAEDIRKIAPPIMVAVEAVTKALNYAYFGTAEPPKKEAEKSDTGNPRKTARKASSSAPSEPQVVLELTQSASGA